MDALHYYLCFSQMQNDVQLGNTETQKKPWTPSAVGWISHFLKEHWLPQGRDGMHQGSPPFRASQSGLPLTRAWAVSQEVPTRTPFERDTISF